MIKFKFGCNLTFFLLNLASYRPVISNWRVTSLTYGVLLIYECLGPTLDLLNLFIDILGMF